MKQPMKPDPKLKEAIAEIKKICEKYDCGGLMMLSSQHHGEYLAHFPTWSKCQWEAGNLRFKAKGKDDGTIVGTVHMLQVFQERCAEWAQGFDQILEMVETKMVITGGPKKL